MKESWDSEGVYPSMKYENQIWKSNIIYANQIWKSNMKIKYEIWNIKWNMKYIMNETLK